ncbi:Peptidoglycan-N-acetylglucosamine deacetylase [Atribacter laminatus]|uniref:Peptidoglycan-N-acetylglucosamine deacetylase n=1 Tax=Atribacter laminatus TaxID=2847778 RepID=A0A7T1F3E6_ATRLM|nr:Peptidoglycan-N-acetylglucosamine deacetylase [Atribacter laminatus]
MINKKGLVCISLIFFLIVIFVEIAWGLRLNDDQVYGYNCVRLLSSNYRIGKKVALTFDDVPNMYTQKILKILRNYRIKATFFMVGYQVNNNPDLAREIVNHGHEIGNHSYTHRWSGGKSVDELLEDIDKAEKCIVETTGQIPLYLRPPGGLIDENIKKACGMSGYGIVLWTVDSRDWFHTDNRQAILDNVLNNAKSGSIILLHSLSKTVDVLPEIIETLHKRGYQIEPVSNLMSQ